LKGGTGQQKKRKKVVIVTYQVIFIAGKTIAANEWIK